MAFLPSWRHHLLALGVVAATAAMVAAAPAQAATYTVMNTNDTGPDSLRQAILDANANPGADTITFSVTGTITLTTGQLTVTDNLTIDGPGAATLTVSGNNTSRVFEVASGVSATLEGVTVADGSEFTGGGVLSSGSLVITDSVFSGNASTQSGGGIASLGALTVTGSTFSTNSAGASGGGIYDELGALAITDSTFLQNSANFGGGISNSGTLNVTDSTFSGNSALRAGGGINSGGGPLTIAGSSFSTNTTLNGGGIFHSGALTVTGSSFSGNSATGQSGGGLFSTGGQLTVTDSTFSENSSVRGGGGVFAFDVTGAITNTTFDRNRAECATCFSVGGAIGLGSDVTEFTVGNSTLSGNSANRGAISGSATAQFSVTHTTLSGSVGGGISSGGLATLQNTIVANSTSGGNCFGAIADGGGNLSWPDTTCPGINDDPELAALQNNGGPTETMALPSDSPAIDAAVNCPPPTTDQRGVSRPQGPACDIGAFELEVTTLTVSIDVKPGSFPNSINTAKKGVIPVAVLGSTTFDASEVDPSTVCFGDAEDASQRDCTVAPGTKLKDVNGDGFLDLVLHFNTEQTGIDPGDTQACLTGELFEGTSIEGCDSVKAK